MSILTVISFCSLFEWIDINKTVSSEGRKEKNEDVDDESSSDGNSSGSTYILVDPSAPEEADMDGFITYSINAQNEICSIHKPGNDAESSTFLFRLSSYHFFIFLKGDVDYQRSKC